MRSMITIALMGLAGLGAAAVLGSPTLTARTSKDLFTEYFGDKSGWEPIRAIDVYPNATFDGKPPDEKLIFGYNLPNLNETRRTRFHKQLDRIHGRRGSRNDDKSARNTSPEIEKRWKCMYDVCECYDNGAWIKQYQLFGGVTSATNEAQIQIQAKGYYEQWKEWYLASDGVNWLRYTKGDTTATTSVYHYAAPYGGRYFNYNGVWNEFWGVINRCKGRNPDSAGGWILGTNFYVRIDPTD